MLKIPLVQNLTWKNSSRDDKITMRYLLSSTNTLVVRGPASFRLLAGEATVLGAPLDTSSKVVVMREKQLPLETTQEADLELSLGDSGSIFEVEGSTIPKSWKLAIEALHMMECGRVMILGATDVGKSTLTTYLLNGLLRLGMSAHVVDADIGQADIGPPTTVGSAVQSTYISSLIDLSPQAMIFIGHTSPGPVERKLIDSIERLEHNDQQGLTIINTDGWVLDPEAVVYKTKMIEATKPDLILGIARGTELHPILSATTTRSMKIEAPETVLMRSRRDRREIRIAGYNRFLSGGAVRNFPLRNIRVKLPKGLPSLQAALSLDLNNLILGLLDSQGYLLQLGILLEVEKDTLRIYSRLTDGLEEIELGFVRLSVNGVELGYLE